MKGMELLKNLVIGGSIGSCVFAVSCLGGYTLFNPAQKPVPTTTRVNAAAQKQSGQQTSMPCSTAMGFYYARSQEDCSQTQAQAQQQYDQHQQFLQNSQQNTQDAVRLNQDFSEISNRTYQSDFQQPHVNPVPTTPPIQNVPQQTNCQPVGNDGKNVICN
jgi:hypothetical protein